MRKDLERAVRYLVYYCTAGIRIIPSDQWMSEIILQEIFNIHVLKKLKWIVSDDKWKRNYIFLDYCKIIRKNVLKVYNRYFLSFCHDTEEGIHNELLDMYWNPELKLWENRGRFLVDPSEY